MEQRSPGALHSSTAAKLPGLAFLQPSWPRQQRHLAKSGCVAASREGWKLCPGLGAWRPCFCTGTVEAAVAGRARQTSAEGPSSNEAHVKCPFDPCFSSCPGGAKRRELIAHARLAPVHLQAPIHVKCVHHEDADIAADTGRRARHVQIAAPSFLSRVPGTDTSTCSEVPSVPALLLKRLRSTS